MVRCMLETDAFFQKQIERCNLLAEQALNQTEQEFWLRSARRWQAILQVKNPKRAVLKPSDLSGEVPSRLASSDDQGSVAVPSFSPPYRSSLR